MSHHLEWAAPPFFIFYESPMKTWLCKGCNEPLKEGQVVRLNGCVGEYQGNGRAGSFDAELLNDYSIIAWHEVCFKNAKVNQKLDDSASIMEEHDKIQFKNN